MSNREELIKKVNAIAREVMNYSRDTLLVNLRFLDLSLSALEPTPTELYPLATDGRYLAYDPLHIIKRYKAEKEQVTRDMLHVILHCVFCHMFVNRYPDREKWDLACDIAVETTMTDLKLPCIDALRAKDQTP